MVAVRLNRAWIKHNLLDCRHKETRIYIHTRFKLRVSNPHKTVQLQLTLLDSSAYQLINRHGRFDKVWYIFAEITGIQEGGFVCIKAGHTLVASDSEHWSLRGNQGTSERWVCFSAHLVDCLNTISIIYQLF